MFFRLKKIMGANYSLEIKGEPQLLSDVVIQNCECLKNCQCIQRLTRVQLPEQTQMNTRPKRMTRQPERLQYQHSVCRKTKKKV